MHSHLAHTTLPQIKRSASFGSAVARTGHRAARVAAFLLETYSRLAVQAIASSRARAIEFSWVAENACALHGVRPTVHGQIPSEPCVLVANHISYFDPVVLASLLPLTAVAKREVCGWPLVGELSRKLGTLYVTRECAHSGARCLRQARRALEGGVSVLVFPEGTTPQGECVLPFKRGIFGIAARAGVPVVPVCIRYDRPSAAWVGDDPFLPHYMKAITHACTRVDVCFMDPVFVPTVSDAGEVAESARRAIASRLRPTSFAAGHPPIEPAWPLVVA